MSYENDPDVSAFSITKPKVVNNAADLNNPSGYGYNGKTWKSYNTPEEGVNETLNAVQRKISTKGINTPETLAGNWVTGDSTQNPLNGQYAKNIRNELLSAGLKLNPDGTIPNTPEAAKAVTQAIIKNETAKNKQDKFLKVLNTNPYETDPDIQAFSYSPPKQVEKPKGFGQEFAEPLKNMSYEDFKKQSLLYPASQLINPFGNKQEALENLYQKGKNIVQGVSEFAQHPIESLQQVGKQIVEHPGQVLGEAVKGIIYDPETLLPIGAGAKVVKAATVPEQLAQQAAKRASIGAAGASNKTILQAAMDIASPELKKDLVEKFSKGETHLLNEQALIHQLEADQLPIPIRLTEGQATQNPTLISRERNERGFKEQYVQRFNEQNKALADNAFALKEITAPSVTTSDHVADAQEIIEAINQKKKNNVQATQAAYKALADQNGGKFPVDGKKFAENAIRTLGEEDRFDYLPSSMQKRLNEYAEGKKEMNFNLFRNLDSDLSAEIRKAQSANDGNAVYALSKVKDELLNLPLTQETEALKPLLTKAKATAKADFDLEKYNKAYKDVVGGKADTQDLIPSLVLRSKNADFANTLNLLSDNPKALENLRSGTLDYLLKDSTDASGNFSAAKFTKHINNLDVNKKLFALFGENTETIRNLAKTAQRIEARPKGSFVNDSNTLTGLGAFAKQYAGKALEKIPGVKTVTAPITVAKDVLQERAARKQLEESLKPGAGIKLKNIGKK
jgi:hypothetical protein